MFDCVQVGCARALLAAADDRAPELVNTRDKSGYTCFHRATARPSLSQGVVSLAVLALKFDTWS